MQIIKNTLLIAFILIFGFSYSACQKEKAATPPPFLEINEADMTVNLPASEMDKSISINTNVESWKVSSNKDWCSVSPAYGSNPTIDISVLSNETLDIREAQITVHAAELSETITVIQLGTNPVILFDSKHINLDFNAQQIEVKVTSNVVPELSFSESWIKQSTDLKSIQVDMVDLVYNLEVELLSNAEVERKAKVYFTYNNGELNDSIEVTQALVGDAYNPDNASAFEKDKKLAIQSVTLTPSDKYQSGEGIANTIDGSLSTLYHSPWGGMTADTDLTMEYTLDPSDATIANYVVLHPRTSGSNGIIKSATVWINTEEDTNYKKVGTIESALSNNPVVVRFATPVVNPRNIKVVVTDAFSGDAGKYYVSLAEYECYESRAMNAIEDDLKFFTDITCSELVGGTTVADITQIKNTFLQNIAAYLLAGQYPAEYRVQNYEPYREVSDLAEELKTSTYSQFENMTGMFFEQNEEVIVFVGATNGENLNLRVTDFGQTGDDYTYPLSEGLNVLSMKGKGNGYLGYYTPNYQSASPIKVHIASGQVNGYFDSEKHNDEDGKVLLDNAVSDIMDIRGERVHLAYSVNALRNQCYGRMDELINIYDNIVSSEQSIMGLEKYNRLPKNRMFGRVIWSGYMHADGWGAAFHDDTMGNVANPDNLMKNNWGVAHEFGHVNQVRPGMKWVGTTECTNNIYSAWAQYIYTPNNLRLEHENVGGTIGGRFNAFLNNGLIKGQEWGIQGGPDSNYGIDSDGTWGGDHFVKLAPLWQLHMYYHIAGEGNAWHKPYFWAEIFEKVRTTNETGLTDGELQINFVKNACDAVQQDLSDFFIKIGMLKEVDKMFGDYTSAQKKITQAMIDEAISYVSQYPKPETDYIYYISGNCIDAFKNKKQIIGQFNAGVTGSTTKQISHSNWQNVTVFETYVVDELTKITMVGTGSNGNTYTKVPYPLGSTRIEAVGYDGTRELVYGAR